ncbi:MAG: hypothetical protein IJ008_03985 [Clostridia bacterium]|nr:hypothetical protein [Clostridia bacterium]
MEKIELINIKNFIAKCNELLLGKYFSLEPKIEDILKSITESEQIYALIEDCLKEYDHNSMVNRTFVIDANTNKGRVDLPKDEVSVIALVFCILTDISEGRIKINQFLNTYFTDKSTNSEFTNFGLKIIAPFRNLIAHAFNVSANASIKQVEEERVQLENEENEIETEEEIEEVVEEDENLELNELFIKIQTVCDQMVSALKFEKKRKSEFDDAEYIINSIIEACNIKNLEVLNGLVIGLNYISKKVKTIKYGLEEINTLIYEFYNQGLEDDDYDDDDLEDEEDED